MSVELLVESRRWASPIRAMRYLNFRFIIDLLPIHSSAPSVTNRVDKGLVFIFLQANWMQTICINLLVLNLGYKDKGFSYNYHRFLRYCRILSNSLQEGTKKADSVGPNPHVGCLSSSVCKGYSLLLLSYCEWRKTTQYWDGMNVFRFFRVFRCSMRPATFRNSPCC